MPPKKKARVLRRMRLTELEAVLAGGGAYLADAVPDDTLDMMMEMGGLGTEADEAMEAADAIEAAFSDSEPIAPADADTITNAATLIDDDHDDCGNDHGNPEGVDDGADEDDVEGTDDDAGSNDGDNIDKYTILKGNLEEMILVLQPFSLEPVTKANRQLLETVSNLQMDVTLTISALSTFLESGGGPEMTLDYNLLKKTVTTHRQSYYEVRPFIETFFNVPTKVLRKHASDGSR